MSVCKWLEKVCNTFNGKWNSGIILLEIYCSVLHDYRINVLFSLLLFFNWIYGGRLWNSDVARTIKIWSSQSSSTVYSSFIEQQRNQTLFLPWDCWRKHETLIESHLLIHTREPCRLLNFENYNVNKSNAIKEFKGPTSKSCFVRLLWQVWFIYSSVTYDRIAVN